MAQIVIEVPDEAKQAFDERARTMNARTGGRFADGAALLLEVVEGHLVAAEQEKYQESANKEFKKVERRVRRMIHPNEDD